MVTEGKINLEYKEARTNYIKSIEKGLLKVFSKMGISTLRSYHGAQIFEAIGISKEVIDNYFTGTVSKIGGIGLDEICRETTMFHEEAYKTDATPEPFRFESNGSYAWRKVGEHDAWNPELIGLLQWSTRTNDYKNTRNTAIWLISRTVNQPLSAAALPSKRILSLSKKLNRLKKF
jgi:glutamate synthase (NADPH/NADH) large chain